MYFCDLYHVAFQEKLCAIASSAYCCYIFLKKLAKDHEHREDIYLFKKEKQFGRYSAQSLLN
jgi:hypothetical protein